MGVLEVVLPGLFVLSLVTLTSVSGQDVPGCTSNFDSAISTQSDGCVAYEGFMNCLVSTSMRPLNHGDMVNLQGYVQVIMGTRGVSCAQAGSQTNYGGRDMYPYRGEMMMSAGASNTACTALVSAIVIAASSFLLTK